MKEVKPKTITEVLKEASLNELDLLTRLMVSPERSGFINNPVDEVSAKHLAEENLLTTSQDDKLKAQVIARFLPEERKLLEDLFKTKRGKPEKLFTELQLSMALTETVEIIDAVAQGITFRWFATAPETIALIKKGDAMWGPHPEQAENSIAAEGLYFGIKAKELGEEGSIYNTQIRSVLGSRKPNYQITDKEIYFESELGVPVHIWIMPTEHPLARFFDYPEQAFWGSQTVNSEEDLGNLDIIFLPNPLGEYLKLIEGGTDGN